MPNPSTLESEFTSTQPGIMTPDSVVHHTFLPVVPEPGAIEPGAIEPGAIVPYSSDPTDCGIDMLDVIDAIAHNMNYIRSAYDTADYHNESLEHRIMVVGHGRHGKDTVAEILATELKLRLQGSTSYAVIPLLSYALEGTTTIDDQELCYAGRHDNRKYWYDFCNMLRVIDPLMLIKLVLSRSDIIIGTRSKIEFTAALDYFKPFNVIWVQRRGFPDDPTMDYSRADVAVECNKRDIRHTTLGNNDDIPTLRQQIKSLISGGIILKGDVYDATIRDRIRDNATLAE